MADLLLEIDLRRSCCNELDNCVDIFLVDLVYHAHGPIQLDCTPSFEGRNQCYIWN
jgi:hypothetical protein